MTARERLCGDLARYYYDEYQAPPYSALQRLRTIVRTEAVWAIALYRFGQYLFQEASVVVRIVLRIPYGITLRLVRYAVGIHLYPDSSIGQGLYIGHYGGIWISPRATLGTNCSISQGVTIGVAGKRSGPVLGDRVWVGPHAVITGPARIGSGAVIAANSFVVSDVPENAMAIGVPARIIADSDSASLLGFPDMMGTHRPGGA